MTEAQVLDALEKELQEQDALLRELKSLGDQLNSLDKQADFDTSARGMTKTDFAAVIGEIDLENAVISGVSVITAGEAKGHGMLVDGETLQQVKSAAETYTGGLKVKTDHFSGFNQIVGTLKNFVIDGDQLRADLHLLKAHEATPRILEMATIMPGSFGLSISFSGEHITDATDTTFARCSEIYSADLVDQPAANPSGLFSVKVDSALAVMTPEEVAAAIQEALAPVMAEIAALKEAAMPSEKVSEDETPSIEISASNTPDKTAMSELTAELAAIKAIVSNFGAVPAPVSVVAEKAAEVSEPSNFQEALAKVKSEGLTGIAATKETINRYPTLFVEARNNGIRTL